MLLAEFMIIVVLLGALALVVGLIAPKIFGGGRRRVVGISFGVMLIGFIGFGATVDSVEMAERREARRAAQEALAPRSDERPSATQASAPAVWVSEAAQAAQRAPQPVPQPAARPAPPSAPQVQIDFVAAIEQARQRYNSAANDMARGAVRPERASAVCQILSKSPVSGGFRATGWIGTIDTLTSTSSGHGVLAIRLDRRTTLKTYNMEFADTQARTLLTVGSPLFDRVSAMRIGQRVVFDGIFIRDRDDCTTELSLGVRGGMTDPDFLFRFTDVRLAQ